MLESISNDPLLTMLACSIAVTSVIVLGHVVNIMVIHRDTGSLKERLLWSVPALLIPMAQVWVLMANLPQ